MGLYFLGYMYEHVWTFLKCVCVCVCMFLKHLFKCGLVQSLKTYRGR
jgi:hypothetical protein